MSGGYATLGAAVDRLRYHKRLGRRQRVALSAEEGSMIFLGTAVLVCTGVYSVRVFAVCVCVCLCVVRVVVCCVCHRSFIWRKQRTSLEGSKGPRRTASGAEAPVQEDNLRTPLSTDTEVLIQLYSHLAEKSAVTARRKRLSRSMVARGLLVA